MTTEMHEPTILTYYTPDMAPPEASSFSKSPTKPRRFMEFLGGTPVAPFVCSADFPSITRELLATAHEEGYIDAFLAGDIERGAESNGIGWTPEFRDSVLRTNGSLLAATRGALEAPSALHFSPTSGFHHATPHAGQGFCTFSGQVIAALDVWRTHGRRGAWIDLDGHYGNSIEDSRDFAPDLNDAIPFGCNVNPVGKGRTYLDDLLRMLGVLNQRIMSGDVSYISIALGADNHVWDSLGGQVTTAQWIAAVDLVFEHVRAWTARLGKPLPVVLALFGGYRDDHPESVLGLHAMGLARALYALADVYALADYRAPVLEPVAAYRRGWR